MPWRFPKVSRPTREGTGARVRLQRQFYRLTRIRYEGAEYTAAVIMDGLETYYIRFKTHCSAAFRSPDPNLLISAETKCDAKFSATVPSGESVTRATLVTCL